MNSFMKNLPKEALEHLKRNLGSDFDDFVAALELPPLKAVRVNTLKADPEEIKNRLSLECKTAYCDEAFLSDSLTGNHPYHKAGLLYFQEPSAMLAVQAAKPFLVELFERSDYPLALDMCAAPGGKSGQLAELLSYKGGLVSNEAEFKRAHVLASNLERLGVTNVAVTSAYPDRIAKRLSEVFDVVVVDAPCSGEGMLRKEPAAAANMNEKTMLACADRQRGIISAAVRCLKGGGILIYSTCTLNVTENEGVLLPFVESGELTPLECPHLKKVRLSGVMAAYRAFPQDGGGEGHFVCVMRKSGESRSKIKLVAPFDVSVRDNELAKYIGDFSSLPLPYPAYRFGDEVFLSPRFPSLNGLSVVRAGVHAASIAKSCFVPAHGYAVSLTRASARLKVDFTLGDGNAEKYLGGEQLPVSKELSGYGLAGVDGYPLGLVKVSDGWAKNHYPKGLRTL